MGGENPSGKRLGGKQDRARRVYPRTPLRVDEPRFLAETRQPVNGYGTAALRAVGPPRAGRSADGLLFAMI